MTRFSPIIIRTLIFLTIIIGIIILNGLALAA